MNGLITWLLDLLYPPKCMFCGRLMDSTDAHSCGKCLQNLPEYDGALRNVEYFEKTVAPFFYEDLVRAAVLRYKFHGMQDYAGQFAKWMAVWVKDNLEGEYDLISWVPCSRRRRWTRGFDQSEVLAKALAAELGLKPVGTLKKIRHNPKQSGTKDAAARKANVLGVYRPINPKKLAGKRILLVDDVLTTGATLSECGKTLRMAGSGDLVAAVIAAVRTNMKE